MYLVRFQFTFVSGDNRYQQMCPLISVNAFIRSQFHYVSSGNGH